MSTVLLLALLVSPSMPIEQEAVVCEHHGGMEQINAYRMNWR